LLHAFRVCPGRISSAAAAVTHAEREAPTVVTEGIGII